jgi:hypothetical protein
MSLDNSSLADAVFVRVGELDIKRSTLNVSWHTF